MLSTVNFTAVTLPKPSARSVNILKNGITTQQTVIKLNLSKPPPTGIRKYHYLQHMKRKEQMCSVMDFLRWYNKKYVVLSLEAMQKMTALYHGKDIDMLKLGCTLPKPGQNMSRQTYRCKFLSHHGRR